VSVVQRNCDLPLVDEKTSVASLYFLASSTSGHLRNSGIRPLKLRRKISTSEKERESELAEIEDEDFVFGS
jgi:hypothetical protein